ncbi:MAG: O-antigen ligase family protein [Clostridia bacterium]|nr:O-antigen ligase family protein [Clostridia bacterium]
MEIVKNSWIYKLLLSFVTMIENTIKDSGLFKLFTIESKRSKKEGLFEKTLYAIIKFFRTIFKKLKLDKLFNNSIFAKPHIWIGITIALAPILETMQILLFVLASIGSFILKILLEEDFKFRYTPLNSWVIMFILIYALSAIFSLSVITSMQIAMLVISFILFYFVIINSITTQKQLNAMLGIFVGIGLIIALYGIYQYLFAGTFASGSFVDKTMFQDITTRVSGTFENPNVMGEYLLLVIPVALTYFFNQKGWIKKIISLGIVGIMVVSLALTYSRGCYLGIAACVGVFLLLVNIKSIILFLAGIITMPFVLPASIMNRLTSIGNTNDSSTSYRISIWKGALDMIKDYWYRPIGQGTVAFNSIYPLYSYSGVGAEHTHNLFLQILIETGIFGFVAFVGLIFKFFQYMGSGLNKSTNKNVSINMIAFISGMVGFLIQSIFDNTWYNNRIILIFWMFVGLAVATRNLVKVDEKKH